MNKISFLLFFFSITALADVSGGGLSDYFGNPITSQFLSGQWPLDVKINGTLPAFGSTPTFNLGTLNGAALNSTLVTINSTLGSPFQVGGSIGNSSFGISGTLPAYASTPTFNLGTIGTAATAANQVTAQTSLTSIDAKTPALGQALAASSTPVVLTAAQVSTLTPLTSITANAGTNLNTSLLALESGGNLATAVTRLTTINTTLGSPFQSGGSIGNTSFGISGTLPAYASTPTFNLGTISTAATAANQVTAQTSLTSIDSKLTSPLTVTGPLTDTQLRASAVPVTANAGTNLNTSALNLEATQSAFKTANHTDLIATQPRNVAQVNGVTVNIGTGTASTGTQRVAVSSDSSITANAGTNLNTSALALDSTVAKDSSLSTLNTSVNTLLKPANTLAAVTTVGTITNALPIGTNSIGQVTANAGTNLNTSLLQLQSGANKFLDTNGSGTISALNGAVTITTNGASNIYMSISGTFTATLGLQADAGDGVWAQTVGKLPFPSGAIAAVIGSPVQIKIACGGFKQVRLIATAYTSGTANVTWNAGSGVGLTEVFNFDSSALQVTANAGTNLNTSALALSATQTSGAQKTQIVDGSGNVASTTTISGTAVTKQPQDTNSLSTGTARYYTSFATQQSAATAANASVWAARNAVGSAKTAIIENVYCRQGFNAANPITRTQQSYVFQRFSAATMTGGVAQTAGQGDSSDAASVMTDIRLLDTGLTSTGVTFVANNLGTMACDTTQGNTCQAPVLVAPAGWRLAPGEGLVMRLGVAAVAGTSISCTIGWREQ